ncbi:MAG: hypothetical protein ORN54_05215 [Cyclobacteriaceae bacterium]|nr:hypothetical protein [Cyclobacteriaceae bacterium]
MKVVFSKKYERQFDKLSNSKTRRQIVAAVKSIIDANRLEDIPSIKKLKGFTNAYRVRIGQFRIGLIKEPNGTILIAAFDQRKDFYDIFP